MRKIRGVTLLEIILVLAIVSALILFGLRQFEYYQKEQYGMQLRHNADSLLEAMAAYYQAFCSSTSSGLTQEPLLSVFDNNGNLYTDLQNGYLPQNWQPLNPLLNESVGNGGYFVQFNSLTPFNYKISTCTPTTGGAQTCSTPQAIPNTSVIIWKIQIVMAMADPETTMNYFGLSGADCATDTYTAGQVVDCTLGSATGTPGFLVWQRLPSLASPAIMGSQWMTDPWLKAFNMQYTHDPMFELYLNGTGTPYNYYCGG